MYSTNIESEHEDGRYTWLPQAQSHDEYMAQFNAAVNAVIEEFRAKHGNNKTAKIGIVLDKELNSIIIKASNY